MQALTLFCPFRNPTDSSSQPRVGNSASSSVVDLSIGENSQSRSNSPNPLYNQNLLLERNASRFSARSGYTTPLHSRPSNSSTMYSLYNESLSTLQPGEGSVAYPDYDDQRFHRHDSIGGHSFVDTTGPYENQGPPPIPPPHSVPVNSLRREKSQESFDLPSSQGIISTRTPSPLRNAMDDVMFSLDSMQSKTPNTPKHSPIKETSFGEPSSHRQNSSRQWSSGQSPTRGPISPKKSPSKLVKPLMTDLSNFSALSIEPNLKITRTNDTDDEIPFDPNSYNSSISHSPSRQNSYLNVARTISTASHYHDQSVSRADTFRSLSSVNTNSLSMASDSTTPTTISNLSVSSAGSLVRRRNESYYKMQGGPGQSNPNLKSSEKPVSLPRTRTQLSSQGSLKLKKSTGFLKKIFSGSTSSTSSAGSERSSSASLEKLRLRPQKSQKSLIGSSNQRSASSLSLRGTIRKVSGKSFSGRTAISSMDLYPTKSNKTIGPGVLPDTAQWIEIHRNVHRTNSLSKHEKEQRKMRPQVDGIPSIEPIEHLARIGGNETIDGGYTWDDRKLHLSTHDFSTVDSKICSINSWPFMTPSELARGHILKRFTHPLDQLRAAFDFCASKLKWEALVADDDFEEGVGSLARVMQNRRANPLEVAYAFKMMCDVLSIRCNVVMGYLKSPGEVWHNPGIPRPNHYWNAVMVDGLWRMIDSSLASPSFPTRDVYSKCDTRTPEYFYFLARPCEFVFTHVPYNMQDEHIVPQLSHDVLIALPLAGPSAFKFNLELQDFSTSLTRLQDLDIAELTIAVPQDVEIFAEVIAGTFPAGSAHLLLNTHDHLKKAALAQVFWKESERYYRVKAVLPPSHSQGALNIYVGPRGSMHSITKNTLSLAYSIPMIQDGENPNLDFVVRHPTPHSDRQDIYVNEPQCRDLVYGHNYAFSVQQHSSRSSVGLGGKLKMAIQSPRGKITKLSKAVDGSTKLCGIYEGTIKCAEAGTWRGLILADSGNAWSVYAEWHCS